MLDGTLGVSNSEGYPRPLVSKIPGHPLPFWLFFQIKVFKKFLIIPPPPEKITSSNIQVETFLIKVILLCFCYLSNWFPSEKNNKSIVKHLMSLSDCLNCINIQPSQSFLFPLMTNFKFNGLFKIYVDAEEEAPSLLFPSASTSKLLVEVHRLL